MKKILCSTGAFITRYNNRNHKLISKYAKCLKCDGFEFMFYNTWYDKVNEISKDVKNMDLYIPVFHCEKSIGELISQDNISEAVKLFTINCQVATELNSKKLVLHLWNGITSDKHIENNIKAYDILHSIAKYYNLTLTVENVICNQQNPLTHFKELYQIYPNIKFTFDTKMSAFHNQLDKIYTDEFSWLWSENHIQHLHINDFNGSYGDWSNIKSLHIGEGWIDFNKFFNFLNTTSYNQDFTIEATTIDTTGFVDCNKLNKTFQRLKQYIC